MKNNVNENLITEIVGELAYELNNKQLKKLEIILSNKFSGFDIFPVDKKQLPSTDINKNIDYMNYFLNSKKIEGAKDSTLKAYRYTIYRFISSFNVDILKTETNHIRMFLYDFERKGNKSISIDNHRRNLNSFFEWLLEEELIIKNPLKRIKKIKVENLIKEPFSDIELVKIKDTCKTNLERAVIDLLLSTGVRCNELCNIKICDIDFISNEIKILGKGAKERKVYMSAGCRLHIMEYLNHNQSIGLISQYLFCCTRKRNGVYGRCSNATMQQFIRNLGIKGNVKNCHIHRFRRTFCCELLRKGMDILTVQILMGHSSIATTRIYANENNEKAKFEHSQYIA